MPTRPSPGSGARARAQHWSSCPRSLTGAGRQEVEYPAVAPVPVGSDLLESCVSAWSEQEKQSAWTEFACAICDSTLPAGETPEYFTVQADIAHLLASEVAVALKDGETHVALLRWPNRTWPVPVDWGKSDVERRILEALGHKLPEQVPHIEWNQFMNIGVESGWTSGEGEANTRVEGTSTQPSYLGGHARACDLLRWGGVEQCIRTANAYPVNADNHMVCVIGTRCPYSASEVARRVSTLVSGLNIHGKLNSADLIDKMRVPLQATCRPYTAWAGYQLSASALHPEDAASMLMMQDTSGHMKCRLGSCAVCRNQLFRDSPRIPRLALANGNNRAAQVLRDRAFRFGPVRPEGSDTDIGAWEDARRTFYSSAYAVASADSLQLLGLPRLSTVETWLLGGFFNSGYYTVFRLAYTTPGAHGNKAVCPAARMRGNHMA
jgi:hypothetical protein